jgi:hypothetical protein
MAMEHFDEHIAPTLRTTVVLSTLGVHMVQEQASTRCASGGTLLRARTVHLQQLRLTPLNPVDTASPAK